jgi:hypothetical protein
VVIAAPAAGLARERAAHEVLGVDAVSAGA